MVKAKLLEVQSRLVFKTTCYGTSLLRAALVASTNGWLLKGSVENAG
jgi:hypothetical protein